jgi:hypothetical protein
MSPIAVPPGSHRLFDLVRGTGSADSLQWTYCCPPARPPPSLPFPPVSTRVADMFLLACLPPGCLYCTTGSPLQVRTEDRFKPAFYLALRNTLVTDDIEKAKVVAFGPSGGRAQWRVVTKTGELIDNRHVESCGGCPTPYPTPTLLSLCCRLPPPPALSACTCSSI